MSRSEPDSRNPDAESLFTQGLKILLYIGAFAAVQAYHPVATTAGFIAFCGAVVLATVLAGLLFRARLRSLAVVALGLVTALAFHALAHLVRSSSLAESLGVAGTIYTADVLDFGLVMAAVLTVIRFFAKRYAPFAVIEALTVVAIASYTLIDHRGLQINRPYWFADALLALGWDPVVFLKALGVAFMVLGLLMVLRRPGVGKGWLSFLAALAVGCLAFIYLLNRPPPAAQAVAPTASLVPGDDGDPASSDDDEDGEDGASGKDKDKDGKGGGKGGGDGKGGGKGDGKGGGKGDGKGGGKGNSPLKDPNKQPPPNPVALVTFHDDYEQREPILYIRQQVLSRFDQTHLAADTSNRYDLDVINTFPSTAPIAATDPPAPSLHKRISTSMFLMVDHPQPIALSHAIELTPLENPNPSLFVAAYGVVSDVLDTEWRRLVGRRSIPDSWDAEKRKHYTAFPDDPRYEALADELFRDLDPRYQDDDLMKAVAIKRYLEKNGFYTLKETYQDATDPTAAFLFGSMRGYCVHFAHSAVLLMRSQGIAARVAVGYAVDTSQRGSGSSMLILGNMAHAWPEIHLDGVGWVTFDVYPEQSDQPLSPPVDQDLTSMLGEIARKDPTGGLSATGKRTPFPWLTLLIVLAVALGALVASTYLVKLTRRLMPALAPAPSAHRWALRSALDSLADVGLRRAPGETRERFAHRVAPLTPHLGALTQAHYAAAFGPADPARAAAASANARTALGALRRELRQNLPWWKVGLGAVNPLGWWLSR